VATERLGGFTLFEVVLSMGILALLAASVYAVVSSAIGASSAAMDQQLALRRIDAFLRVTRDAFLNLPAEGTVTLEIGKASGGEAEQRLVIGKAQHIFGIPGGSLVLAARPRSDGTRTITMLRIPPNAQKRDREKVMGSAGVPLLPKARKPRWSFSRMALGRRNGPPEVPARFW
jgi:prepilin-type N-terminal cleavage/methylation domain-containing protein